MPIGRPLPRRAALAGLVLAAAAAVGLRAWWAARAPAEAYGADGELRPNIVVIDIDSLSPEYLGQTRDGAPITPNIDGLLGSGVKFTNAISNSGWTLPALGSILDGRLPVAIEEQGGAVRWRPQGVRDLPQILSMYGYDTAAFFGGTLPVASQSAFAGGFAELDAAQKGDDLAPPTARATAWISKRRNRPFFAYIHELDLNHPWAYVLRGPYPYEPPGGRPNGSDYPAIWADLQRRLPLPAAQAAMVSHYEAILHLYDGAVGSILHSIDAAGIADRTVVVLLSDHGQDFFHHAYGDHGLLYDSTIRIPLVIRDPRLAGGRVVTTTVQGVDLAPTLLDRAGIPPDQTMDGRSLASLLGADGTPYAERPVYGLSDACHLVLRADGHALVLRDGRDRPDRNWMPPGDSRGVKLSLADFATRHGVTDVELPDCSKQLASAANLKHRTGDLRGASSAEISVELYDLAHDPDEKVNIAEEEPERAVALLRALLAIRSGQSAALAGVPREEISPEQLQKLREQGYWGFVGGQEGDTPATAGGTGTTGAGAAPPAKAP
jgi:arylsulfatase A-like enzyme